MLSYAGVPLLMDEPEVAAWVEKYVPPSDIYEFAYPTWSSEVFSRIALTFTHWGLTPLRPVKVNTLFWPTGAARWAVGHFLVDDTSLGLIRQQIHPSGGSQILPATLAWDDGTTFLQAPLWMLPARPLMQLPGAAADGRRLYLLTLVDDRYFWWYRRGTLTVTDGVTTWAQLYSQIATLLGITLDAESVHADYLTPSSLFAGSGRNLPLVLDAVARATGQRIVRGLDGTADALNVATSRQRLVANLTANYPRIAGGEFQLLPIADIRSIAPASVTVRFPRADDGTVGSLTYDKVVLLNTLAIPEYAGLNGFDGTKVFNSTAIATYAGGASPTNQTQLDALATKLARDYYYYRLATADALYAGVVNWWLEGLSDYVEWTYRMREVEILPGLRLPLEGVETRVRRPVWNDADEDLGHTGSGGSTSITNIFEGDVTFNGNVTVNGDTIFNAPVTINQFFNLSSTEVTITGDVNNYVLGDISVIKATTTSDRVVSGIADGTANRLLVFENMSASTGNFIFSHQDTNSTAANRIITPDGCPYILKPGMTIWLIYNAVEQRWRIFGCACCERKEETVSWSASTNNFATADANKCCDIVLKVSASGAPGLSGIVAPSPERPRMVILENRASSSASLTVQHQSSNSSAANRIISDTGADFLLAPGQSCILVYDMADDRWVVAARCYTIPTPTTYNVNVGVFVLLNSTHDTGTASTLEWDDESDPQGFLNGDDLFKVPNAVGSGLFHVGATVVWEPDAAPALDNYRVLELWKVNSAGSEVSRIAVNHMVANDGTLEDAMGQHVSCYVALNALDGVRVKAYSTGSDVIHKVAGSDSLASTRAWIAKAGVS